MAKQFKQFLANIRKQDQEKVARLASPPAGMPLVFGEPKDPPSIPANVEWVGVYRKGKK